MLQKASLIILLLVASLSALAQSQPPVIEVLDGLDPVLLVQGKETQGELTIAVTRGRFKYLFANAENKAIFEKDSGQYEIQLEGHCARMGAPVRGNPNLFSVHQGRVYVFGSDECKKRFDATPEKYLESGTEKPSATPEALQKGQALIAKAVAAMGGAARLDGLTSYHEKRTSWQTRQSGEIKVTRELLIAFPDRLRIEQTMPHFTQPDTIMHQATIITPNEVFGLGGPRGVFTVSPAFRLADEQEIKRKPLSLLRARKHASFKAIALSAEQVAIEYDGESYVLGLDPATGRMLSLAQRRRGPDGSFGQVVQTFSEFRAVDGLTLPFKITATFDGQPWKEQSAQVTDIVINGKVDPALFEKPKVEKPQ